MSAQSHRRKTTPASTAGSFASYAHGMPDVGLNATAAAAPEGWSAVEADDRWPGRYTAYVRAVEDYRMRITPGDNDTYTALGFQWTVEHPSGALQFGASGQAETVEEAARQADECVAYYASGQAEADYHAWEADQYAQMEAAQRARWEAEYGG